MSALTKIVPESLRAKLVLFFMTILLWLALSNSLLIYLFVSYVREYNKTMETITLTNSINSGLIQELDDEIIDILYGKVSFHSGSQYDLLDEMEENLDQIEQADKEGIFTNKIVNVRESLATTKEYIDKLGEDIKYNQQADVRYITYEYITIATDLVDDQVRMLLQETLKYSDQSKQEIEENIKRDVSIFAFIFMLVIFFSYLYAWYISGNLVKPIHLLRNKTNEIANGNIQIENIDVNAKGEIGDLYRFSNQIIRNLKEIILNVRDTVDSVSLSSEDLLKSIQSNRTAAKKVANETQSVSSELHQQKNRVNQTSIYIKDITAQVQSTLDKGRDVQSLANESFHLSREGTVEVSSLKNHMNKTFSLLEEAVTEVHSLSDTYAHMDSHHTMILQLIDETNGILHQAASSQEREPETDLSEVVNHLNTVHQTMLVWYKQSKEERTLVDYKIKTILTQLTTIKNKVGDDYPILQVHKLFDSIQAIALEEQKKYAHLMNEMMEIMSRMDISQKSLDEMAYFSETIHSKIMNVAAMEQLISLEEISEWSLELAEQFKKLEMMIEKFKV